MPTKSCQQLKSVLKQVCSLNRWICLFILIRLDLLTEAFESNDLNLIFLLEFLSMGYKYGRRLWHNSGVYYDLEIIYVHQVFHDHLPIVSQFVHILILIMFLHDLLTLKSFPLKSDKQVIVQDHSVVYISVVVEIQIVIEQFLDLERKETQWQILKHPLETSSRDHIETRGILQYQYLSKVKSQLGAFSNHVVQRRFFPQRLVKLLLHVRGKCRSCRRPFIE